MVARMVSRVDMGMGAGGPILMGCAWGTVARCVLAPLDATDLRDDACDCPVCWRDTLGRVERLGRGANGGGEEDDEPPP